MKNWNVYWMDKALRNARHSRDRSSKVGCVIVTGDNHLRSFGYNDFPDECRVQDFMHFRPEKYAWTVHAEAHAILRSARTGISISGCKLYTTMVPCAACALTIVQAGIKEVLCYPLDTLLGQQGSNPDTRQRWEMEFQKATQILRHCRVKLTLLEATDEV